MSSPLLFRRAGPVPCRGLQAGCRPMGLIRNGDTRPIVVVYIAFMHVASLDTGAGTSLCVLCDRPACPRPLLDDSFEATYTPPLQHLSLSHHSSFPHPHLPSSCASIPTVSVCSRPASERRVVWLMSEQQRKQEQRDRYYAFLAEKAKLSMTYVTNLSPASHSGSGAESEYVAVSWADRYSTRSVREHLRRERRSRSAALRPTRPDRCPIACAVL